MVNTCHVSFLFVFDFRQCILLELLEILGKIVVFHAFLSPLEPLSFKLKKLKVQAIHGLVDVIDNPFMEILEVNIFRFGPLVHFHGVFVNELFYHE